MTASEFSDMTVSKSTIKVTYQDALRLLIKGIPLPDGTRVGGADIVSMTATPEVAQAAIRLTLGHDIAYIERGIDKYGSEIAKAAEAGQG